MILKEKLIHWFGPLYGKMIDKIAYGPWGTSGHRVATRAFRKIYDIEDEPQSSHKTLGEFFLRDKSFVIDPSPLVAPAESYWLEGPQKINPPKTVSVKGLRYDWSDFYELDEALLKTGVYYNFYLAPHHYHWVHSPCDGSHLKARRHQGALWPVNPLGRKCEPKLYSKNERLTFTWDHPTFGKVAMICIGALGVSGILSPLGEVSYNEWTSLKTSITKGEKISGFRLGSSVLLILEHEPTSKIENPPTEIKVGQKVT